jgi:hypothetical protein
MPSKYDRREAELAEFRAKSPGRPATAKNAEREIMKVLRKRWPKSHPNRTEALNTLSAIRERGLTLEDLELAGVAGLMQLDEDRASGDLEAAAYHKAHAVYLETLRKLKDSMRLDKMETAPGTLHVVFDEWAETLGRMLAVLRSSGHTQAALELEATFGSGAPIIDVTPDGFGDVLEVD